jgi:hypothetical protein
MRRLACVLIASVTTTACVSQTYRISSAELQRLASIPPADRGQQVRVVQELSTADAPPPVTPVTDQTTIILVPDGSYGGGFGEPRPVGRPSGTGGGGLIHGGGGSGSAGSDAKAEAVAYIVIAATALIILAATEGQRYDGWVQLNPMMPVHLFGPGGYIVRPLAQIDAETAAWATRAVVRPGDGPWRTLGRAPLDRAGWTYTMMGGATTVVSADGTNKTGAGTHIQIGNFPTHQIGILADFGFAWRPNSVNQTAFAARFGLELDVLPIDLGPVHGGLFGGAGFVRRQEDGITTGGGSDASVRGEIGALLQLELTTRLALTGRVGMGRELGATTKDLSVGLAVY